MDAFLYFLPKEKKMKFIKMKKENPVQILKEIRDKLKNSLDVSFLYSEETLKKDRKLREWISKFATKK